jgi:hypothetical protein
MLKFDASIFGGELPVGLGVVGIAVVLPGGDFVDEDLFVGNYSLPEGSLSVLLGRHGAMKPAGRVRGNIST